MNRINKLKENCCGCSACANICPKDAISMIEDEEGFLYPNIDEEKCINCGLCNKVCDFNKEDSNEENIYMKVYAVKHRNEKVRMSSSSGGVYTAISDFVLKNNGSLVGAMFSKKMTIKHDFASTKSERDKFKGSKYVQSEMGNIFSSIKEKLQKKEAVCFSGTACQVAGLKSFLENINTDNLITIDLICHGAPTPKLWNDYRGYIEKKYKSKISKFEFRHKDEKTGESIPYLVLENGKILKDTVDSIIYSSICFNGCAMRPSCHNCKYTNMNRVGDITLGDFWGIEKTKPNFQDGKGISLVLTNTKKGSNLFENIKQYLIIEESNKSDCLQYNLQYPTKPSEKRDEFWRDYINKGFKYISKKYQQPTFKRKVIVRVKLFLKRLGILK